MKPAALYFPRMAATRKRGKGFAGRYMLAK